MSDAKEHSRSRDEDSSGSDSDSPSVPEIDYTIPYGFRPPSTAASGSTGSSSTTSTNAPSLSQLETSKGFDIVKAQFSQMALSGFMLWMSGNSINIFSVIMTVMVGYSSLSALLSINTAFAKFENRRAILLPRIAYLLLNFAGIALFASKCHWMGLVPTHAADWIDSLPIPQDVQRSVVGYMFSS